MIVWKLLIYSDVGRLIRPVLKVQDNKLLLTKDIINNIKTDNQINKIKYMKQLLIQHPNIIEYIDNIKSNSSMIEFR